MEPNTILSIATPFSVKSYGRYLILCPCFKVAICDLKPDVTFCDFKFSGPSFKIIFCGLEFEVANCDLKLFGLGCKHEVNKVETHFAEQHQGLESYVALLKRESTF